MKGYKPPRFFGFTPDDLAVVGVWTTMLICCYYLLRRTPSPRGKTQIFDQHLLSLFNTLMVLFFSYSILLLHRETFYSSNTDEQITILCIVFGYLLYDIFIVSFDLQQAISTNDSKQRQQMLLFLLHHAFLIAFILYIMHLGVGALIMVYLLVIYDVSSIFLALRNMLRDIGYTKHPLIPTLELLFAFSFTVCRIIWGSYVIARIVLDKRCPLALKLMLTLFQLLNYVWYYSIVSIFIYKIRRI